MTALGFEPPRRLAKERQDELAATNVVVEESLQAIHVVKAFTNEWYEYRRYATSMDKVVKLSIEFASVRGLFFAFVISAMFGGIIFMMWSGMQLVQDGEMMAGELLSFIVYTMAIGGSIASLGDLYTQLLRAIGATERMRQILDAPSEIATPLFINAAAADAARSPIVGNIEFQNVAFTYPTRPELQILKNINLTIKAGQKVALVGQSGAGKSKCVVVY